ncbi:adenosylcobinamide-GDP ribazoletransferase [Leptolyngbya sp. FACHB-261]|uniref:adenosylcobinamide-GDP ribazoletransferase n=1 Tax=Leptolyngbya sp. FACHB-261 TaxID=2692806 RepID=UPI0016887827|nr:adenosylcobinamide-GDP ribazoletransferase [Leptolyngbya sp. FACHB-261]MBD2105103.1 adenosylcobinamide-GDP ribazoletransferase [Leptolyngbya sp. FACHB-261]
MRKLLAALVFYTVLPLTHPTLWCGRTPDLNFEGIVHLAPLVGLLLGTLLGALNEGFRLLEVPDLLRGTLVVVIWLWLTGGLHLDGAMDTADGLAVMEPERRLQVMADSVTGAYGVMVAGAILLLKVSALTSLSQIGWFALVSAAAWGRWGQLVAAASYPYLRTTGKGKIHHRSPKTTRTAVISAVGLGGLSILLSWADPIWGLVTILAGSSLALLSGFYFYRALGGHTGDTYGAVVEWTEALLLCVLVLTNPLFGTTVQ